MSLHISVKLIAILLLTIFFHLAEDILLAVDTPVTECGIAYARGGGDDHGDHGHDDDDHGDDSGAADSSAGGSSGGDTDSADKGDSSDGEDSGDPGAGDTGDHDSDNSDGADSGDAGGHDSGDAGDHDGGQDSGDADSGDAGGHDDADDGEDDGNDDGGDHDGDDGEDTSDDQDHDFDTDPVDPDHVPHATAPAGKEKGTGHHDETDFFSSLSDFFAGLFSLQDGEMQTDHEPGILLAVNMESEGMEAAGQQGLIREEALDLERLDLAVIRLRVPEGEDEVVLRDRLREQGYIFHLNHYYHLDASGGTSDQLHSTYPYGLIGWPVSCGSCGLGTKIGMIDGPVSLDIPVLARQQVVQKAFASLHGRTSRSHGTAIASILVGCPGSGFCGLLPDAKLFAAAAFTAERDNDPRATALAIARSLDWLVAEQVQVINMSFSGPDNLLLREAVQQTLQAGPLLLAAAGNQAIEEARVYPAAYPGVIAVTAIDEFRRLYRKANRGEYISFAAPGVRVPVPEADGTVGYRSGTSYATAFCTAMAARILRLHGNDRQDPVAQLKHHTIDLGAPGKDPRFGWGLVSCAAGCSDH